MHDICKQYVDICTKYAQNMPLHRLQPRKSADYMPKNMQKICSICNKNMQKISKKYAEYAQVYVLAYALPTLLKEYMHSVLRRHSSDRLGFSELGRLPKQERIY